MKCCVVGLIRTIHFLKYIGCFQQPYIECRVSEIYQTREHPSRVMFQKPVLEIPSEVIQSSASLCSLRKWNFIGFQPAGTTVSTGSVNRPEICCLILSSPSTSGEKCSQLHLTEQGLEAEFKRSQYKRATKPGLKHNMCQVPNLSLILCYKNCSLWVKLFSGFSGVCSSLFFTGIKMVCPAVANPMVWSSTMANHAHLISL